MKKEEPIVKKLIIQRANYGFIVEKNWTDELEIAPDLDKLIYIIKTIYKETNLMTQNNPSPCCEKCKCSKPSCAFPCYNGGCPCHQPKKNKSHFKDCCNVSIDGIDCICECHESTPDTKVEEWSFNEIIELSSELFDVALREKKHFVSFDREFQSKIISFIRSLKSKWLAEEREYNCNREEWIRMNERERILNIIHKLPVTMTMFGRDVSIEDLEKIIKRETNLKAQ